MKKMNVPLVIGGFILFGLVCIILFPEMFTQKSPYTIQQMRFFSESGKLVVEKAPFKPSSEFWFGSDDLGRDIYSYMVYGTRLTILLGFLIALVQFLIAIPIALLGGTGHTLIKSTTYYLSVVFSAIPALLISILVLQIDYFVSLDKGYSILAFILVLSCVGWPKLGRLLMERVEFINQQPFILGEVAIGKSKFGIAKENILPHLAPEIGVLFFMEIARNLSMMMQLGIFGVFIGNLKVILDSDRGNMTYYTISYEPEWASMLSTSRTYLTIAPWTVIFPALAFFVSVLGFNLFGEGLRNILQSKDSQLIPRIRKIMLFDVKSLISEMKRSIVCNKKKFLTGIGLTILVLVLGNYPYNQFSLKEHAELDEQKVLIGSDSAKNTADYIAWNMKELSIQPVEKEDYIVEYTLDKAYEIVEQACVITISTPTGEVELKLIANEDFALVSSGQSGATTGVDEVRFSEVSGRVYDASKEDLYSIREFSRYKDRLVLLDTTFHTPSFIDYFIAQVQSEVTVKGFILIGKDDETIRQQITNESSTVPRIKVSKEIGKHLTTSLDSRMSISSKVRELGSIGRNIIGIYRGKDKALEDEILAIGLSYNYMNATEREVLAFNLELMKHLCSLEGNKRSLMFIFMDGTISDTHHGIHSIAEDFPVSPQKVKAYIDLTGVVEKNFASVVYSSLQAQITRPLAWSLGQLMGDAFRKEGIKTYELDTIRNGNEFLYTENSSNNAMYWEAGIATLIIATPEASIKQASSLSDLGEIILKVIRENNY
jgi:peptide/nickel transport system permease protein